jgi:putative hemolysin
VIDLLIVLLLILANGLFAMSEIAVVSANRVRLQQRADAGSASAARALALAEGPNRFLATVQIGITLIGVVAGAFGSAALAGPLADALRTLPRLAGSADAIAFGLVVALITYLSLVVGELAPKRIGLNNPERVAMGVAGLMDALARIATPVVRLLSLSTEGVLWLLRVRSSERPGVSEAEIATLVEQGLRAGVVEPLEREIIENAFWIGERRVRNIMTPRVEVAWLYLDAGAESLHHQIAERPFSRYPLAREGLDDVVGVIHTRNVLAQQLSGAPLDLEALAAPPLFVPESQAILDLLSAFQRAGSHIAMVIDEYGGVAGIVTLSDIFEQLVGETANQEATDQPTITTRPDGVRLADGRLTLEALAEALELPLEALVGDGGYDTLGGFVVHHLGRIPESGDAFALLGHRFEVVGVDGQRIDRVQITEGSGSVDRSDEEGGGVA